MKWVFGIVVSICVAVCVVSLAMIRIERWRAISSIVQGGGEYVGEIEELKKSEDGWGVVLHQQNILRPAYKPTDIINPMVGAVTTP